MTLGQSGTAHPFASLAYASCFEAPMQPLWVAEWNTSMLRRPIPDTNWFDVAGCYPLTPLAGVDRERLAAGLDELRRLGAVSVVLVLDPWFGPPSAILRSAFDIIRPFKTHWAFDRKRPINYTRRHWREVRIARRALEFRRVEPTRHADVFGSLYGQLTDGRRITEPAALGRNFFCRLAALEGLRLVAAYHKAEIVAMMSFVVAGRVCHAHLAASTAVGRRHCAHYGCYAEAIENFTDCEIIHFGGAPGMVDNPEHGIAHVKRKLANLEVDVRLCGAILDELRYRELQARLPVATSFFPAYRLTQG